MLAVGRYFSQCEMYKYKSCKIQKKKLSLVWLVSTRIFMLICNAAIYAGSASVRFVNACV